MWSASILVTTATIGCKCKKDASLSSASATKYLLAPSLAFVPALFTRPPTTNVGSLPSSAKIAEIRLVVVVFPWVPATAIPCRYRISSANISARLTTGTPIACARLISMFLKSTADELTTTSAPSIFLGLCPRNIIAPILASRSMLALCPMSEPEIK